MYKTRTFSKKTFSKWLLKETASERLKAIDDTVDELTQIIRITQRQGGTPTDDIQQAINTDLESIADHLKTYGQIEPKDILLAIQERDPSRKITLLQKVINDLRRIGGELESQASMEELGV